MGVPSGRSGQADGGCRQVDPSRELRAARGQRGQVHGDRGQRVLPRSAVDARSVAPAIRSVVMRVDPGPLTWATVARTWHLDLTSATVIVVVAAAYAWCYLRARNAEQLRPAQAWCFGVGIALWALATIGAIGAYAHTLFWMRALQVLTLLYVVPFVIALSKPVTVVRGALGPAGSDRIDRFLATRFARVLAHPLTTSLAMLGTPWLLYLTPLVHRVAGKRMDWRATRIPVSRDGVWIFLCPTAVGPLVPHKYPSADLAADHRRRGPRRTV